MVEVLAIKGDKKLIKFEDIRKENGEVIGSANNLQMIFTVASKEILELNDMIVKTRMH